MDRQNAIEIVQAWGRKNHCPGTLETMEQMRDEIAKRSELITLKDLDAFNIFMAGMRELFYGPATEEEAA
jgi:hypothetical protein